MNGRATHQREMRGKKEHSNVADDYAAAFIPITGSYTRLVCSIEFGGAPFSQFCIPLQRQYQFQTISSCHKFFFTSSPN